MAKYTKREIDFGIFLIHRIAESVRKPVPEVYRVLDEIGILDGYVFKHYDTLHTLGEQYLVDDVVGFAREKGAAI